MPNIITEDMIEQAALKLLVAEHKYTAINCFTRDADTLPDNSGRSNKKQVVLPQVLLESLITINPHLPLEVVKSKAAELALTPESGDPVLANYQNYQKLRNGVTVEYQKDGRKTTNILNLIDFTNLRNNSFIVASQMWIQGKFHWRRPDLIVFVNGLPLVFIELKNSNINVKTAYDKNLIDYNKDIPWLFNYNQICVLSNGMETRLGSFSSGYEHFFEWLKVENEDEKPDRKKIREDCISLEYFIRGLCKPETLIDYIENFVLFDRRKIKIIAKNHQYHGVNNAYKAFLNREKLDGKLGVFWHTQGSGKSYSMVMITRKIKRKCEGNFTFLIVTDRDALDTQIYKNFLRTEVIGDKEKVQPASSTALREALKTNAGILFTLIHKFRYDQGKQYPVLSERSDILVFVDEAHRTQYKDLAENMRRGLPNAQYMAFTGTPLLGSRHLTNSWFGKTEGTGYLSRYTFSESIQDNATVPLYYIKRVPGVELLHEPLSEDFAEILEEETLTDEEKIRLENHYAKELEVLKRDDRLDAIACHIVKHFPQRGFKGKGMVISVDKFTAVKMYDKVSYYWKEEIKKLNKEISEIDEYTNEGRIRKEELKQVVDYMRKAEMAVVVSAEDGEEDKFNKEGLSIQLHRQRMDKTDDNGFDIEDNFKDPNHPLQLVFVCAMWLTGFDAPSVSTLYLDKPMKSHTLMQTISRANRVFPDKNNGIIVDYLDVFKHLRNALAEYSPDDEDDIPVKDIETLFDQLNETIKMTADYCHDKDMDLSLLLGKDTPNAVFTNLSLFEKYANIIVSSDEIKNEFIIYANTVENLFESLRPEIFKMNYDPSMKNIILYLRGIIEGKIRPEKLEKAQERINELLDQCVIAAEGEPEYIINEKGREIDLSKIDTDELREKLHDTQYKNMAITNLREYIAKKIEIMLKRNCTRTDFAERFRKIIDEYNSGGSQNDDFYEKIIKLMESLRDEEERHIKEDLSEAELELFDLLQKEKLSKEETKIVKLAAKTLYKTLVEKQQELFVIDWYKDPKPRERIKKEITDILDTNLPESYDRVLFEQKSSIIFDHIIDQAISGYNWVA
ncbi:putatIve type i restriction enzyme hindviip r protein [Treponema primitia ZAS-2]|uniref:Type I restriction enzyme endonuclease subunit n=1 Tax=Treponema primitia (strain ATCC BAA-887 / DSM 12427 / ZAS-2) TaxID=545694 RepID=F5YQJ6_TREPZ|nr:type I restriction endonuclease subunit R [Treponema primitia]AEF83944.1 putatIve type i restriction enzyme hindviip r protein [Treponema primitia ZAS-2]